MLGPKAAAAMRLIDGLEYDDQNQPINLDVRIDAAKAQYGGEVFGGATPPPATTTTTTPTPTTTPTTPVTPVHPAFAHLAQGARVTPVPEEDAEFEQRFSRLFPHAAPAEQPAT
jgi:hypothetical protein